MCDTFVALPPATTDGSVLFGKNSDREPNEAQSLEFHPGRSGIRKKKIQCTYITVPQVRETLAVLISRPFWMWGAEMGTNEKGVTIGNEAVFSWIKPAKDGVLTGMDIIRLTLERATSAENALQVMIGLIQDHGQGGIGGYEDKHMAYNNSFLIADPAGAWVLETVGKYWAAKKIDRYYAISNRLTLQEDFDLSHPKLIENARKKGKLKKGKTFNFSRCYSDWFYTTFSASAKRHARAVNLLERGNYSVAGALEHLRDHGTDTYLPDRHFLGSRLCAHSANAWSRKALQTTASMVVHLTPEVCTAWATGTASPCISLFKPFRLEQLCYPLFEKVPGGKYDPDTLWWKHEHLHRTILKDFGSRSQCIKKERDETEHAWLAQAILKKNDRFFSDITLPALKESLRLTEKWLEESGQQQIRKRPWGYYVSYWNRLNRKAGIILKEN